MKETTMNHEQTEDSFKPLCWKLNEQHGMILLLDRSAPSDDLRRLSLYIFDLALGLPEEGDLTISVGASVNPAYVNEIIGVYDAVLRKIDVPAWVREAYADA